MTSIQSSSSSLLITLSIIILLLESIHCLQQNNTISSFGSYDLKYGTVSSFTISQDSNGNYQCASLSLSKVELKIQDNVLTFNQLLSSDKQSTLTCYIADGDTTGEKHSCQLVRSDDNDNKASICLKIKNTMASDKKLSLAINFDSTNCASNNFDIQAKCSNPTSLTSASSLIVTFNYDAANSSSSVNGSTLIGGIIAIFLFGAIIIAGGAFGYWYFIQKRREKLLGDNIEFKKTTVEEA